MSVDVAALGIDRLSVGERLELIELIWDSLPEQVSTSELPAEHLFELKKRRAAAIHQPGIGKPWREVLDSLEN
jgi:putative addiction module component (TIGR02574 family)